MDPAPPTNLPILEPLLELGANSCTPSRIFLRCPEDSNACLQRERVTAEVEL